MICARLDEFAGVWLTINCQPGSARFNCRYLPTTAGRNILCRSWVDFDSPTYILLMTIFYNPFMGIDNNLVIYVDNQFYYVSGMYDNIKLCDANSNRRLIILCSNNPS